MRTGPRFDIFPHASDIPDAVHDLCDADSDTEVLRTISGARSFDRIVRFERLKRLWCFAIDPKKLAAICQCRSLQYLYIEQLKTSDLSPLAELHNLKVLSIDANSQAETLDDLGCLEHLSGLAVVHFRKVKDLTPLSRLRGLRSLAVAGSMWTRMTVRSLDPLAGLANLRFLHLTNLKVKDESLHPLGGLRQLDELDIANFHAAEEFAWLAGRLPNTKCSWFMPYQKIDFETCRKCGRNTMVMLTGKRKPCLCRKCDAKRVEKHVAAFEAIKREAARVGG